MPESNPLKIEIKEILENSKTIAVVGLSDKPERESYRVAKYLKDHGYTIIDCPHGSHCNSYPCRKWRPTLVWNPHLHARAFL